VIGGLVLAALWVMLRRQRRQRELSRTPTETFVEPTVPPSAAATGEPQQDTAPGKPK
jgi:hypothetical protein